MSHYYYSIAKRTIVPLVRFLQARGMKYRFLNFRCHAIGHMALEPDCFLKEGALGMRPPVDEIWLAPENLVANKHLLRYWEQHLRIWKSPLARLLLPVAKHEELGTSYIVPFHHNNNRTVLFPKIQSAWGDREPLLKLTKEDYERGWAALKKLGVPEGAWFVCIHNRESGFWGDSKYQSCRNGDIRSYIPAIEMIVDRGGWCIRMGDKSMTPLPPMRHVIDYALHDVKSDWMDVFLCATCKCFLGSNSGLVCVSSIFGRRAAMANMLPLAEVLPYGARDLGIPKLLRSLRKDRRLTFKEVFDSPAGNDRFIQQVYEKAGLKVVDNTADEILGMANELLELAEGPLKYSPEDEELQRRFKALMQPQHCSYGAPSRVGRHFLRKHADLLDQAAQDADLYDAVPLAQAQRRAS